MNNADVEYEKKMELIQEYADEQKQQLIDDGVIEDETLDEECESWCSKCRTHGLEYMSCHDKNKGFWYCKKCGWRE